MAFKITIPSFLGYLLLVVHGSNGTHHHHGLNLFGLFQPPSLGLKIHVGQDIHSDQGHSGSHHGSLQGSEQGLAHTSLGGAWSIGTSNKGQTGQDIHSNHGHQGSYHGSHQGSAQDSAHGSAGFHISTGASNQGQAGQEFSSNHGHEVSHPESHQGSGQGSAQGSVGFDIHAPIQGQAAQGIHPNYEHEVSYHGSHQGSGQGSVGIDHSINVSNQGNGQVNSGSSGYEASHPVLHHTSTGEVAHGGQASISVGVTKPDIFGALETIAGDIHHKVQDTKQKIADKLAHRISASVGTQVHGVKTGHSYIDHSNHHSGQSPSTVVAETSVHQNSQVSQGNVVDHPAHPLPDNKPSYEAGVQINHTVQHETYVPTPSHGYPTPSGHETSSGQTQSGVATSNSQGISLGIESHGSHGNFASSGHHVSAEGNYQGGVYKKNEVKINGPLISFQHEFSSSKGHQAGGDHNAGYGVSTGVSHQGTVGLTNQAATEVIIGSGKAPFSSNTEGFSINVKEVKSHGISSQAPSFISVNTGSK
ncbi:hypothetical protein QAD02_019884, partial [Eretmocerus hayati]